MSAINEKPHRNSSDRSTHEKDVEAGAETIGHTSELDGLADAGAAKVEASARVWGKYSRIILFVSLGIAAYVYSLDSTTTWAYLQFGTSSFGSHSSLASVEVAKQVIIAVGKPVIARLADLRSRPFAYLVVLACYVIGYIIIATAKGVSGLAAGSVIYSMGYTGLQLLTQVVVADYTSLRWRGLLTSIMSAPFIINAFVGSEVYSRMLANDTVNGWRWGYGMFAIIVPAALTPLLIVLLWSERKAKKLGIVPPPKTENEPAFNKLKTYLIDSDFAGLLILGVGLALLLVPLTLSRSARGGWNNPSIIAMIVLGPIFLVAFCAYEAFLAQKPIITREFLRNRAVVGASLIGFFDFVSFYLTFLYTSSFIYVLKTPGWTLKEQGYFGNTQTIGLTVFAIAASIVMAYTHRYKWLLVTGLTIRLFGVGLMIHSRGADAPDAELIMTQIIQAIGGGIASICSSVSAQASVLHKNVAMATAVVLLITEIGGAIGSAVAGAIWTNVMPNKIAQYLPGVPADVQAQLFGNTVAITTLDPNDPVRLGVLRAYGETMEILLIVATVMSVPPLIISIFMPNWYLGDAQNAIDGTDITGKKVEDSQTTIVESKLIS